MESGIIIAGFGGQGILFAGEILSAAALNMNKETTWFPSYGPEMRGGTANCTVIIRDAEIASPIVERPDAAIVLNNPSFEKYEPAIRSGGNLFSNSSLIQLKSTRSDITVSNVEASAIAEDLGVKVAANVVMIGAFAAMTGILTLEACEASIKSLLGRKGDEIVKRNIEALRAGAAAVKG